MSFLWPDLTFIKLVYIKCLLNLFFLDTQWSKVNQCQIPNLPKCVAYQKGVEFCHNPMGNDFKCPPLPLLFLLPAILGHGYEIHLSVILNADNGYFFLFNYNPLNILKTTATTIFCPSFFLNFCQDGSLIRQDLTWFRHTMV